MFNSVRSHGTSLSFVILGPLNLLTNVEKDPYLVNDCNKWLGEGDFYILISTLMMFWNAQVHSVVVVM